MLEILGFIILVIFAIIIGIGLGIVVLNSIFESNVGGVPNTIKDRLLAIVLIVLYFYFCSWIYTIAPFTITMKS